MHKSDCIDSWFIANISLFKNPPLSLFSIEWIHDLMHFWAIESIVINKYKKTLFISFYMAQVNVKVR